MNPTAVLEEEMKELMREITDRSNWSTSGTPHQGTIRLVGQPAKPQLSHAAHSHDPTH